MAIPIWAWKQAVLNTLYGLCVCNCKNIIVPHFILQENLTKLMEKYIDMYIYISLSYTVYHTLAVALYIYIIVSDYP